MFIYPASNPRCCLIEIFKKYCRLLPESKSCKKLYLRCRKIPTPNVWYCDQPYGVNCIKTTVKELCKKAGIEENFTNHSLRASCASRMYDKNVPEQLINEVTGHRSDCMRVYKRTSDHLREVASTTVSGESPPKKVKVDNVDGQLESKEGICEVKKAKKKLTYGQMMHNVLKTRQEIRRRLPTLKIKAKKLLQKAKRVIVDVNVNMKISK